MITSKNDANSSLYVALFKEAYDFLRTNYTRLDPDRQASCEALFTLRGEDGRFTSVQEYFSHLKDIYDVGGKKYLMLPLDEPVFEIDANSRDITVPPVFKKNGVSVEGDSIAETLIFRINRFFDYADLFAMNCQIVWEAADKQTQGVDDAFLVDATTDADHLYIMWPLKYSVTKKPGTIKFSVRFHNSQNGGQPSYSFSTKVAAVTINAGQSFFDLNAQGGWTAGYDNANQEFYNSIVNSQDVGADDAKPPYFVFNLNNHGTFEGGEGENYMFLDATSPTPRLEAYIDEEDNTSQVLRVEAATNDTGIISYKWYYIDTLDTEQTQNGVQYELIPEVDYKKTSDTVKVAHKVYYKKSGEDEYTITDFDTSLASHEDIYEKYSTVTVVKGQRGIDVVHGGGQSVLDHVVGKYFARAINTVGANTDDTDSFIMEFPSPTKPVIVNDLEPNGYLEANGHGSIAIEAEVDAHGAKASYEWLYSPTANGGFTPIFGETSTLSETDKAKFSTSEDGSVLNIDGMPGFYKVTVISTRNYDTAATASEVTAKVTMPVAAPVVLTPTANTAVSNAGAGGARLVVQLRPYENLVYTSDGVTYQWYTYDKNTGDEIAIEGAQGTWDNASDIVYTVPHGADYQGGYFCKITNHIGNRDAVTETPDFSVTIFNPEITPSEVTPEPEVPVTTPLTIQAGKQFNVPQDENTTAYEANQAAINVTQNQNAITVNGNLDTLQSFTTDDGDGKWIGLTLKTNLNTINGATFNGTTLDLNDVNKAAAAGLSNDTILYWINATELAATAQTITIGATGYESVTITVSFEDTQG